MELLSRRSSRRGGLGLLALAVAACLLGPPGSAAAHEQAASDVAVKAAFLFNFAKFTEWPALAPGAPIVLCVVGDDEVAASLVTTIGGRAINGHALEVWRPEASSSWRVCGLLFISRGEMSRAAGRWNDVKGRPVLTVSDSAGFARAGGHIELFIEAEHMRFAVNVEAIGHAGLRVSSRLLGLARVARNEHGS